MKLFHIEKYDKSIKNLDEFTLLVAYKSTILV